MNLPLCFKILILVCYTSCAFTQIKFSNNNLDKALRKAQKSDKMIFIDGYTSWCGPCKWMDNNVFNQSKLGDFYNTHFVNVKMDMETKEGEEIALKYGISGYPSFLFLDQNGGLLHKAFGARDMQEFLELGMDALDNHKQLRHFQQQYESQKYDPEFLHAYAQVLRKTNNPDSGQISSAYLATQENWSSERNAPFLVDFLDFNLLDEKYIYLIHHRNDFYQHVVQAKVDQKIINIILANLGPDPDQDELDMLLLNAFQKDKVQSVDKLKLELYLKSTDTMEHQIFVDKAITYFQSYKDIDPIELNNMAWNIYDLTDDQALLKQAKIMVEESVLRLPIFENYDTLAHLQFKLNEIADAENSAIMAVKLAQESGSAYQNTQQLIWQIRKAKN